MTDFYTKDELGQIGFKSFGSNVYISRFARIYGASEISIGNNVRIDDFCILSGNIILHNFIHISAFSGLFGGHSGIEMFDYTGLSSRGIIYAETDDYSGSAMTNPMIPEKYRNVIGGKVVFEKHVLVGSGSIVLPSAVIGEGTSVGCMSLVKNSLEPWGVYAGIPCKKLKDRSKRILELEKSFIVDKELME